MVNEVGWILIIIGIFLIVFGIIMVFSGKLFGLGNLPGDIAFEGKNWKFYFPIASSILISIIFSLLIWLVIWIVNRLR